MSNVSDQIQANCKNYIGSACLAAQASLPVLMEFFKCKKTNIINHSNQEDRLVEVLFETATLTCVFDSGDICSGTFLFFDYSPDIIHFIDYCSKTYPYNYLLRGWVAHNCSIQVHTVNKECSLAILHMTSAQIKSFTLT